MALTIQEYLEAPYRLSPDLIEWAHRKLINGSYVTSYPVEIDCTLSLLNGELNTKVSQNKGDQFADKIIPYNTLKNVFSSNHDDTYPLFAYYRDNRFWETPNNNNLIASVTEIQDRFAAFMNWHNASGDSAGFFYWFVSKYLERLQAFSESQNVDPHDDLGTVLQVLKTAIPEIQDINYNLRERRLIIAWKSENEVALKDFDLLSRGEKCLLGLIGDIARRLCTLNPHLRNKAIAESPGIVLIDEIDAHLHPIWQTRIASALTRAFPRLQFIVTTHSPQIIKEVKADSILVLKNGEISHPAFSYGANTDAILTEIFGDVSLSRDASNRFNEIYRLMEDPKKLDVAEEQIEQLRKDFPGIPEIERLDVALRWSRGME